MKHQAGAVPRHLANKRNAPRVRPCSEQTARQAWMVNVTVEQDIGLGG